MDMLVNLYEIDENHSYNSKRYQIRIERILTPNIHQLEKFIKDNFDDNWTSEIKSACYKANPSCFIAINDKHEIVGFAAYDATCKGFFGPLGVKKEYRKKSIATDLIYKTLLSMKDDGYAYAIIGGVSEEVAYVYQKSVNAQKIYNKNNVYSRMI